MLNEGAEAPLRPVMCLVRERHAASLAVVEDYRLGPFERLGEIVP